MSFTFIIIMTLMNDSMTYLSQVLMEVHKRKSASVQNDWEKQLCRAL